MGAGVKKVSDTHQFAHAVLPAKARWVKDYAETVDPRANKVTTREGHVIDYEYIIIAVGLNCDYGAVRHHSTCVNTPQFSLLWSKHRSGILKRNTVNFTIIIRL